MTKTQIFKRIKTLFHYSPLLGLLVSIIIFFALSWNLSNLDIKNDNLSITSIVRSNHAMSVAKYLSRNNGITIDYGLANTSINNFSPQISIKENSLISNILDKNIIDTKDSINTENQSASSLISVNYTFKSGDTFSDVLEDVELSKSQKHNILNSLSKSINTLRIKPGYKVQIVTHRSNDNSQYLKKISYSKNTKTIWDITPDKNNKNLFHSSSRELPIKKYNNFLAGTINNSLYVDSLKKGLPMQLLSKFIDIYSSDIDFQREIYKGDKYSLLFTDSYRLDNGKKVDKSVLLMTSLLNKGKRLDFYRYEDSNGNIGYFNQKGQSAKRAIVKTPIDGARISSTFGRRKHPILGFTKQHNGVDFAVASGTHVYSAGNGIIKFAGRNGGYGIYVLIKHSGGYSTAYAHLSRLSKGIKKGKIVKQGQIVAYSGNTGNSTGPHLHYEVIKNGHPTNPLKIKVPRISELKGSELKRFKLAVLEINSDMHIAINKNTILRSNVNNSSFANNN